MLVKVKENQACPCIMTRPFVVRARRLAMTTLLRPVPSIISPLCLPWDKKSKNNDGSPDILVRALGNHIRRGKCGTRWNHRPSPWLGYWVIEVRDPPFWWFLVTTMWREICQLAPGTSNSQQFPQQQQQQRQGVVWYEVLSTTARWQFTRSAQFKMCRKPWKVLHLFI